MSKKKAEPEAMEVPPSPPPSSSPSKTGSRKGRRKRRNSHRPKEQQASTSKAKDSPRGSHGDRKSGPSRKKARKGRDSQPQQSDSPSPIKGPPSPLYEAAPMFKPPSRRVVVELSSDSEGEAGGDRVQLFDRYFNVKVARHQLEFLRVLLLKKHCLITMVKIKHQFLSLFIESKA